jgi:uncharacterized protein YsxB (DUF464 family)
MGGEHARLLGEALQLGYQQSLRQEIARFLELYHEAEIDTTSTRVICAGIHDSLKNSINHFAQSFQADEAGNDDEMRLEIDLGIWHLNHGRIQALIRSFDICMSLIERSAKYLRDNGEFVGPTNMDQITDLHNHLPVLWKKSTGVIAVEPDNPRRPSEERKQDTTALVEELRETVNSCYRLWASIKAQHPNLPTPKAIREEVARTDAKRRRNRNLFLYGSLILAAFVVLFRCIYVLVHDGSYVEAATEFGAVCAGVATHFVSHFVSTSIHRS